MDLRAGCLQRLQQLAGALGGVAIDIQRPRSHLIVGFGLGRQMTTEGPSKVKAQAWKRLAVTA